MKRKVIFVLTMLLVFSCTHLDKGHVVDKRHEEARVYHYMTFIRTGKVSVPIWHTIYDNEDWILTIEDTVDGEIEHEDIYVTEEYYNKHSLGSWWCRSDSCSFNDNNNDRK